MIIRHSLVRDCSHQTSVACSDVILDALGHGPTLQLKAEQGVNAVHGAVTIHHANPPLPHTVIVEIYEQEVPATARMEHGRMVGIPFALQPPPELLPEQDYRARLDSLQEG